MKKRLKQWLAVILAIAVMASSAVTGFATESSDFVFIPISDDVYFGSIIQSFDFGNGKYIFPIDMSYDSKSYNDFISMYANSEEYFTGLSTTLVSSNNTKYLFIYCIPKSNFKITSRTYNGYTYLYFAPLSSSSDSSRFGRMNLTFDSERNCFVIGNISLGYTSYFDIASNRSGFQPVCFFQDELFSYIPSDYVSSISKWNIKFLSGVSSLSLIDSNEYPPAISSTRFLTVNYLYSEDTPAADPVIQSLAPGTEYSIPSPEVESYTPDIPLVAGTMPEEDLTINVYYSRVFYPLTVQYQYSDGNQALEDVVYQYPAGFNYEIPSPEIAGYLPDKSEITGEMPAEAAEAVVTYSAIPYTLTVSYRFADGSMAAESHQEQLTVGMQYYVTSPQMEGYRPNQSAVSGVMPASDVTHTVTYRETPGGGGGDDPFGGSDVPPYAGKDPFVIPGLPSYTYDPFIIPGLPPYKYNPFVIPDSLK